MTSTPLTPQKTLASKGTKPMINFLKKISMAKTPQICLHEMISENHVYADLLHLRKRKKNYLSTSSLLNK